MANSLRQKQEERRTTWWSLFFLAIVVWIGSYLFFGIDRVAQRTMEYKGSLIVKR